MKILTTFDDETGDVLDAISSETALEIITMLSDGSMVPKTVAERLGTSIQNVRYHLNKMEDAGLVEKDGFRYSERGREMSFYRVSESPTVIVFGGKTEA